MCGVSLSSDQTEARAHVNECLGEEGREEEVGNSDSETYEEYTWCDVTRVRATSMMTPQARASEEVGVAKCVINLFPTSQSQ